MGRIRNIIRPRTSTTLVLAGTTALAASYALSDGCDARTIERADTLATTTLILTVVYGALSARPSRGRVRAAISAATATGAAVTGIQLARAA